MVRAPEPCRLPENGASETPEIWYTKWTALLVRGPLAGGHKPWEPGEASAVRLPPRVQRRRGRGAARRAWRRGEDTGRRPEPGPDDELPAGPPGLPGGRVQDRRAELPAGRPGGRPGGGPGGGH